MGLRVVVIVEGHGEDGAIRTLLERIWYEIYQQSDYIEVIPWRGKQGQLRKREGLRPVVAAAALKLHDTVRADLGKLLLLMLDSEGDCPRELAPQLLNWAREVRSDTNIACVMAHPMFETWFAAAAESLRGVNGLPDDLRKPDEVESKVGKGWIKRNLNRKYKETVDQARFVGHMNLSECRDSSRSFRKLCKELQQRLAESPPRESPPPANDENATSDQG
jgi:hypothetical protein